MSKPEISILMGAYNCQSTVEKAIDSILAQTFQNWEFIICDDGSKDNTWNILQKYKEDKRFILIQNNNNMGLAGTLNVCFQHSSAPYLARQDADDESLPERFQKQMNFLKENPAVDVLSTFAYLVDDDGKEWGVYKSKEIPQTIDWAKGGQVIHASVIMKRSVFEKVNGYNPKAIRVEDYEMWGRMLAQNVVFRNIPEPLYIIHWGIKDYRRRSFSDRKREIKAKLRLIELNHLPIKAYLFLLKPLLLSLIPNKALYSYHQKKMRK